MMKLYYSAGSCSTSCHIALEESGLKYEAIEVDFDNPADPNIALTQKLNPLGTLPVLITDDGKQLDQNISIQAYIADRIGGGKLLPEPGTFERAQANNWLSFVASDFHKGVGGLFATSSVSSDPAVQSAYRTYQLGRANDYLKYVDDQLAGKDYTHGQKLYRSRRIRLRRHRMDEVARSSTHRIQKHPSLRRTSGGSPCSCESLERGRIDLSQ